MFKFLLILLMLNFYNPSYSSIKEKIISQLNSTNNLSFDFIQRINEKNESGSCIIEYPKKIYCIYSGTKKKIIVSNGKSLVIKNKSVGSYYIYSLNKTPLELLLDKKYLISKINILQPRDIDNKFLSFKIFKDNNKISVFFDKKSFNLVGWQTEDIYQNLIITFISSIKINETIDKNLFQLPIKD